MEGNDKGRTNGTSARGWIGFKKREIKEGDCNVLVLRIDNRDLETKINNVRMRMQPEGECMLKA